MTPERLPLHVKLVYGLGDHSVNISLVALTMYFPFYLTEVVGMRFALAGLVPLVGRVVDAFTDVWMGRISDRTRWKAGRRRPYLLIGAVPFSLLFAAIWIEPATESEALQFAYYAGVYALFSVAMTVVAVPYHALLPEMTEDYHERSRLSTYRSVASILGTFFTLLVFKPLADAWGGDSRAWASAGAVLAVWILWPWFLIHRFTWENNREITAPSLGLRDYFALIGRNRSFRRLMLFYTFGRIALDLPMALFLHFFTYVIGRPDDFEPVMATFLLAVLVAMPGWLRFAEGRDKANVYVMGCVGWVFGFLCLYSVQPDWPGWLALVFAALAGLGYSAADMIPWSMIADVADEDEIASGERREGLYVGVFTFLRKLAGALGVALAFNVLDAAGFEAGVTPEPEVLPVLRAMTALVPVFFVVASAWAALGYPLSRARHQKILEELAARRGAPHS